MMKYEASLASFGIDTALVEYTPTSLPTLHPLLGHTNSDGYGPTTAVGQMDTYLMPGFSAKNFMHVWSCVVLQAPYQLLRPACA